MFFLTAIIISLIGLLGATYTDLTERIVPNKLNFGLIITGLLIYSIQSIYMQNIFPIIYSIFGLCFGFFFGWTLWKLGVFAGGDVKLFMALGTLNPFTPALIKVGFLTNISYPIMPISLFIYSLLAFLPYGIIVIIHKLLKNKKERKKIFLELKQKTILATHTSIFISGAYVITTIITTNNFLNLIIIFTALIIWNFLKQRKKYLTIIFALIGLIINYLTMIEYLIILIILFVGLYGLIRILFLMKPLLSKKIFINDLEEGMIPSKTLMWKGKKVIEKKQLSLKELIRKMKNKEIVSSEKEIISSMKARGLTIEEINTLKKLSKKGLISKTLLVKDSIPFVPTILLGYILCLILGDFIIQIVLFI